MTTQANPYAARLNRGASTKFQRDQIKQRARGWEDYHAGKDILAYYDAPMIPCREVGRANYNLGWRVAKESAK